VTNIYPVHRRHRWPSGDKLRHRRTDEQSDSVGIQLKAAPISEPPFSAHFLIRRGCPQSEARWPAPASRLELSMPGAIWFHGIGSR